MFNRRQHNARVARAARQREYAGKREAVEAEYGMAFRDVVAGFAADGESVSATAGILGYSPRAFFDLVRREGMRDWFPGDGRKSSVGADSRRREDD